ncbi:MAG: molybdopterin-dependent oxidoreductase, partial [Deltaproteobacteria bacterium]|nr:molybdopterin-dependent oxidoreductase [Deltaproteobacteria bacterium]
SSTQHPSEVQTKISELLEIGRHRIVVRCPRMGGGFGGKESQAVYVGQAAALAAWATGRPVRVRMNRDQDMITTGKRHPWFSTYEAGFSKEGDLLALKVKTYADGGWSLDLSPAILQRCLFHLDNSYFVPNADFEGRIAKTNKTSNTAFRGFGGPQGMAVVEAVMNHAAQVLQLDPALVRSRNFYGAAPRHETPYGQEVIPSDNRLQRIYDQLMAESDYDNRRDKIEAFNKESRWVKRGIGFQPVKFGISFTTSFLNQAGALVLMYADGSVQLNHGGTEMGQGLHTKMLAICAHELGADLKQVRVMATSTDKVPNTSATAASSGSDLNGQAVRNACVEIRERLRPIAAKLLSVSEGDADTIVFAGGQVYLPGQEEASIGLEKVSQAAYMDRISLSATGYYRTPNIYFDAKTGKGRPFHYYAYGGCVVEVELNGLTGEHRLNRVRIVHDVGNSLLPEIDKGQVEGGFIQGAGWVTVEELVMNPEGRLLTHAPSTYKIPAYGDVPDDFQVSLLEKAPQEGVIHRSKAVGEPPFMHGLAMLTALEHAVGAFGPVAQRVNLAVPATPEALLRAVEDSRAKLKEA